MPPEKRRSPAAANGGANRKSQCPSSTEALKYNPDEFEAIVTAYVGQKSLGAIDQVDGVHYARTADEVGLGAFKTRQAAALANRESAD
ncbi:hypothetical protein JQ615_41615 [Bradyrhizobium jicamae]|uniref:Uncharacterized protein n=1 Tax=Bradyrhizobium jicamae TaxID=280332 RepID=A0ABS5FYC5_9BRAD|nr:hypothetical protein [Bradyrhizobium jicamae]MBR0801832.1 hypothetical protein [Bradyrhizobium jicamae]